MHNSICNNGCNKSVMVAPCILPLIDAVYYVLIVIFTVITIIFVELFGQKITWKTKTVVAGV